MYISFDTHWKTPVVDATLFHYGVVVLINKYFLGD